MEAPGLTDTLLMPAMFGLLGLFGFGLAIVKYRESGILPKFRFAAYVLLLLALFFGAAKVWDLINPSTGAFYRAWITKRSVLYAHWLGFIGPLICLIAAGVYEFLMKRRRELYAD